MRRQASPPAPGTPEPALAFPAYLIGTGLQAALVYVCLTCGAQQIALTRYTLLVLLVPVGALAWWLRTERIAWLRKAVVALVLVFAAGAVVDHARLLAENIRHPPVNEYRRLTNGLEALGVRYARGDYWTAYMVDFLSEGKITVASTTFVRIDAFQQVVSDHSAEAATITAPGGSCRAGEIPIGRWCVDLPH